MHGTYNPELVTLSIVVAMLAAYTGLDLADWIRLLTQHGRRRFHWVIAGAMVLGSGIWSMHFIGMLALQMPVELSYDVWLTGLSFVIAVVFSFFALLLMASGKGRDFPVPFVLESILLGFAMAGMHYTGMAAIRIQPQIRYRPLLVFLSIVYATGVSWVALRMEEDLRSEDRHTVLRRRLGAGTILGVAIAGMHFLAMEAVRFDRYSASIGGSAAPGWLALSVAGAATFVLTGTLVVSNLDRRLEQLSERMKESLAEANQQLVLLSTKDLLTHLPNRSSLLERMGESIARLRMTGGSFTILLMDLDGFKALNESLGHETGDALLKEFARQLSACVRNEDMVSRLGGDEFVVLLEGLGPTQEVQVLATQILHRLGQEVLVDGVPLCMSASMGIASYPANGETVEELLKNADMAMYNAKMSGRNTFRAYDSSMSAAAARTRQIHSELAEALESGRMQLCFQPKFDGLTYELLGAEALLRWKQHGIEEIPPIDFIRVAEQTGQIVRIGHWVIHEVCRQMHQWTEMGLPPIQVAINLSPEQLRYPHFADQVRTTFEKNNVSPSRILFEITETAAMHDPEVTGEVIAQFQRAGFEIAIDDFGTGYSSLAYLQRFRVRQLKIDRFFIAGLDSHGEEGLAIVSAIIALAHSLKMVVVAEGVETRSQLIRLKSLQCDEVQGYLLSKPLPAHEFSDFLRRKPQLREFFLRQATLAS